ncbi:MAG: 2-oxoacid:acceptor oxidoreductase subunit alpha [Planctomycetes bacterium]|nr:2-oxoacid:acceptor oxidoreductase subunit alpha [Planctomycetota bacterium]
MAFTEYTVGFGGAAGDGQASTGDALALICARLGLHQFIYNSYQSVIRGGHVWLRLRIGQEKVHSHGDRLDAVVALNQDALDRHKGELSEGGVLLFNADKLEADGVPAGRKALAFPVKKLTADFGSKPIMQNTVLLGGLLHIIGFPFEELEKALQKQFGRKGEAVVRENIGVARGGYDYAKGVVERSGAASKWRLGEGKFAMLTGNECMAMGAVAAGCKFYSAYPMTPASGILHWFASHASTCGVAVKQAEDEIAVANMAIGAGHAGLRSMCATSGGGFALMTEAIGEASMFETPVVIVNVMRAGPSTGVPTKTEQADLNQVLGASQGDFPRAIIAPWTPKDCFHTMAESFNLAERYQMPVLLISDLQLGEHRSTIDPAELNWRPKIDRGEVVRKAPSDGPYLRYKLTPTGVSPRAYPGTPGTLYVSGTDEHDEQGILISDVFTHPPTRKAMMDKRMRKMEYALKECPAPKIEGPADAEITLIGWGSTWGVIQEAIRILAERKIRANQLQFKYILPFHRKEATAILLRCKKTLVVENNWTGQFATFLRGQTSHTPGGLVLKYDGEPFEPMQIADAVEAYRKAKCPADWRYEAETPDPYEKSFVGNHYWNK